MTQDPPKRLVLVDPQSPFATLAILERHSNEMRQLPDDIQNRQEAIEETEFLLAQRKRMGPLPGDSD